MSYQVRDAHIIDYKTYPFYSYQLRGPKIDTIKPYMICVGAAQSFGPFCRAPFPALLASRLGIQVFNLGIGGAIPAQFLDNTFLKVINNSRLAVIQVLSGRCGSNSQFTHVGCQVGIIREDYRVFSPVVFWREAEQKYGDDLLNKLVEESRMDYIYQMMALIRSVKVPKILFYFSTHKPEQLPDRMPNSPFPHLIKKWMNKKMAESCAEYVECVSSKGLLQKLYDKDGNPTAVKRPRWDSHLQPITQNNYYPSLEMHEQAANALKPICKKILDACPDKAG
jgi:hypothetical protein